MHGFEVQFVKLSDGGLINSILYRCEMTSEINYSAFNRIVLGSSPRHPKILID